MEKIDTPAFKALFTPELDRLADLFQRYGYEIRMAGGAVRDLVIGKAAPDDIDFATTATPEQMQAMFSKEHIRMLHKKGECHGTVTVRINDRQNFEITTLRIDDVCDGRRAEVKFTTDWILDANRRDLTINSMFLGLDGTLYDYFNGIGDLEKKRVVFVGDPVRRIQEDYLRILRYFRFFGRIASDPDAHEPETLDAIRSNVSGLKQISAERIWSELKRIFVANFAPSLLKLMIQDLGMALYLYLPDDMSRLNFLELERVYESTKNSQPNCMTLVASLLTNEEDLNRMCFELKTSTYERESGVFIVKYRSKIDFLYPKRARKQLQDLILDAGAQNALNIRDRIVELIKYSGCVEHQSELIAHIRQWKAPRFPVDGYAVISKCNVQKGPPVKKALSFLFEKWKDSNYLLSEDELIKFWHDSSSNLTKSDGTDREMQKRIKLS